MEGKPLKDFILECADAKGLGVDKLYMLTGIPKHYLEAIFRGEWKKLPPAPYARGYFKKMESPLGLANDQLWGLYKEEVEAVASGAQDRLPDNRFAIKSKNKKWLVAGLVALVFGIYLSWNFEKFLGIPEIAVDSPLSATVISNLPDYAFSGNIDPNDKLYINGEEVYVDKNGRFQKTYNLQTGINTFELLAKRFLGKETKVVKQVIYQPIENDQ